MKGKYSKIIFITFIIVFLFLYFDMVFSLTQTNIPKEVKENKILIKHKDLFGELEYAPVLFDHFKHVKALEKEGCRICHPEVSDQKLKFVFIKDPLKIKNRKALKSLFHENCINCHQKLKKQNKKTGPTRLICGKCHINNYIYKDITYPVVDFDFDYHLKHNKALKNKCELCHHTYDLKEKDPQKALKYIKNSEESCYYCHDLSQKRGPELAQILKISRKKGLDISQAFHSLCLNCHNKLIKEGKKAGPIICSKCHTGVYKSLQDLKKVDRPKRGQKEVFYIYVKNASMKGVLFNHRKHEKISLRCRTCHHERLKRCSECHTIEGDFKSNFVNLATVYHSILSKRSCRGCHQKEINSRAECLSCHHLINSDKERTEIAKKSLCIRCHTGKNKPEVKKLTLKDYTKKLEKEIYIDQISREFEKAYMPHKKIIESLIKRTNKNELAVYFHNTIETICQGCHHKIDIKSLKDKMPKCINCHPKNFEKLHPEKTRLQAAYHIQCINCHKYLHINKALRCDSCHKPKKLREKPLF